MRKKNYTLLIFLLFSFGMTAQTYQVSGTVSDTSNEPLPGVSIVKKGTHEGTTTDFNGKYKMTVSKGDVLEYTMVGYKPATKVMDGSPIVNITLEEGVTLDEVVVTGNRAKPRTILDSPVPIDYINARELESTGKVQVEQMLAYAVPSFNAQTQPISDATAHFDPADLRGLGPSRTLVLINGKRKNQSAQIYLNGTPGKGEVGIDMKSFPNAAVKSIEVLRDGASAQYGSDAIAGVINIILKDKTEFTELNTSSGVSKAGDGFHIGTDLTSSVPVGDGEFMFSLEYYKQNYTNRAGKPGTSDLPSNLPPDPNGPKYQDPSQTYAGAADPDYIRDLAYYQNLVEWATDNPRLGMIVGQPDLQKISSLFNLTYPLGDNAEFYTFNTFTTRNGRSFAYYRAPYWREDVHRAEYLTKYESFQGYHPTFEAKILDNMNVAGFKFDLVEGLKTDLSFTYGRNYVDYTVNNSVNRDYLADHDWSPRSFNPGGYAFSNFLTNLDFSYNFTDKLSSSFGFEYKKERYKGHKGDEMSYYGGGSDSFAGIKPEEAIDKSRKSEAVYVGLDYDATEALLLGGAIRYENFSDFGGNTSWKLNGRYKIGENFSVRASYSTGFRAPSLHQRYIRLTQYIIVTGNPDPQLQGTLPNDSPAVIGLGVPSLKAETSKNMSFGVTGKLGKLNLSADFYNIKVNGRVLFSSQIKSIDGNLDGSDPVEQILLANDVIALQFFINAVNTKTSGLDLVLNYPNIPLGKGKFGANLSANFNKTEIDGEVANPPVLEQYGYDIFDHRQEILITDSRPKSKIALGLNYAVNGFNFHLNNTRFGEVTVASEDGSNDQIYSPKIVTDFNFGYQFSKKFDASLAINNVFDVYPDILRKDLRSANGRFLYSNEVTQMGIMGTNYNLMFRFKF